MAARSIILWSLCLLCVGVGAVVADQHVSGKWVLSVDLGGGQGGDASFELAEEDGKLTGTYSGQLGEEEVTGTVSGNEVEFSFESQAGTVTYKGTVSDGSMEGTCTYGQLGGGTFKGKKVE